MTALVFTYMKSIVGFLVVWFVINIITLNMSNAVYITPAEYKKREDNASQKMVSSINTYANDLGRVTA